MNYDNTNSGIITRNEKGGNESRPDYRGSINVEGRDYWISCWIKTGRDGTKLAGQKYMSLSIRPKDDIPAPASPPMSSYGTGEYGRGPSPAPAPARPAAAAAPKTSGTSFDDMGDDLAF
jgi:hypothetical protein